MYAYSTLSTGKLAFPSGFAFNDRVNQQKAVTSGALHTKGSWVELEAATEREVNGFFVFLFGMGLSGSARRGLLDIGVGAAASEEVLVPDLLFSSSPGFGELGCGCCIS